MGYLSGGNPWGVSDAPIIVRRTEGYDVEATDKYLAQLKAKIAEDNKRIEYLRGQRDAILSVLMKVAEEHGLDEEEVRKQYRALFPKAP